MKKEITKCQNCHEADVELEEIEINGEKKMWCDACKDGYLLEKEENGTPESKTSDTICPQAGDQVSA
jgi:hypothetical protein